ncbi:Uncharacterised protein [Klebsiella pneumoniae]|nr:Uncharacterised protein [Klebsiella pneumoniae]
MALVSNPHSAYSPRLPWLGGIAGLLAGGAILYFWPQWNRTWLSLVPAPVSVYTRFLGVTLEDVPLVTYCHQALLGFLMVLLAPGYGKSTLAAWMMHNPASSRRWPGEVFRAWVTKFGLLVMVFCNLFFLSRVPSGTLALYIFILQHISVAAAVASGVLLLRDARRLARTFDAQLADLRLLMILTLGFQTILPAQIALMSARGVNTPLGWYIVIAQMAGGVTGVYAGRRAGGSATFSAGRREVPGLARGYGALQRHCHTVRDGISPLSHGVCLSANLCRPALAFATPLLCLELEAERNSGGCRPRCQMMRFCLKSRRKLPQRFS